MVTAPLDTILELAAIDRLEPRFHGDCESPGQERCGGCVFDALAPIARKAIEERDKARADLAQRLAFEHAADVLVAAMLGAEEGGDDGRSG